MDKKKFLDKLAGCTCDDFRNKYIKLYNEGSLTQAGRNLVKQAIEIDTDDVWDWVSANTGEGKVRACPIHDS